MAWHHPRRCRGHEQRKGAARVLQNVLPWERRVASPSPRRCRGHEQRKGAARVLQNVLPWERGYGTVVVGQVLEYRCTR
jgi:hypothetical protein